MEPKFNTPQIHSIENEISIYSPRVLPIKLEAYIDKGFKFDEGVVYEQMKINLWHQNL